MRKLAHIVLLLISGFAAAQTSLSFHHLYGETFQNANSNPALYPEGKWFIGLPIISGVHTHFNSRLSYSDLVDNNGEEAIVNVDRALDALQSNNMLSGHATVSLFHLGRRLDNGLLLSVFANEKMEADGLYPRALAEFLFVGNGPSLGEEIDMSGTGVSATHYREIGIGFMKPVNNRLKVGARLKYYQGFFNYSTPSNLKATLLNDPATYAWDVNVENMEFRTSGLNIYQEDEGDLGSHLISPGNGGFGVDLGFEYRMNRDWSVAASMVDLGYIRWNTDVSTKVYGDTTFNYQGFDLRLNQDFEQALTDSLILKLKETSASDEAYSSLVSPKAYVTGVYHYTDDLKFMGTLGARYVSGQFKMLYGIGVTRKIGNLKLSGNVTKLPQQFVNLGGALAVNAGPVQYYMAIDNMVNFSATKLQAIDARLGLNIVLFEQGQRTKEDKVKGPKSKGIFTSSFLGKEVRTRRSKGIYSVIKKQSRRGKIKSAESANTSNQKPPRKKKPD